MLGTVKNEYPEAAFVSEWGVPEQALQAGFDMDFYLDWSWDRNGYYLLCRNTPDPLDRERDHSYFSAHGGGSVHGFLDQYLPQYEATKDEGHFCLITCNHDTARLSPRLTPEELAVAYGMILTMPGVPFLYYGDEIGMRYRNLPTKEAGYVRTGTRTPMQWDASANLGFSTADAATCTCRSTPPPTRLRSRPNRRTRNRCTTGSATCWRCASGMPRCAPTPPSTSSRRRSTDASSPMARTSRDGSDRLVIALNPGLGPESFPLPDAATSSRHSYDGTQSGQCGGRRHHGDAWPAEFRGVFLLTRGDSDGFGHATVRTVVAEQDSGDRRYDTVLFDLYGTLVDIRTDEEGPGGMGDVA